MRVFPNENGRMRKAANRRQQTPTGGRRDTTRGARGRQRREPEPEVIPPTPEPVQTPSASAHFMAQKKFFKPADQLELDETELSQEYPKVLNTLNPNAPSNIVRFSFRDRVYKTDSSISHTVTHFSMESRLEFLGEHERNEEKTEGEAPQSQLIRNQFNFSDRGSQTLNWAPREREAATDPPDLRTYEATATQWEIYDAYMDDLERQRIEKQEKARKERRPRGGGSSTGTAFLEELEEDLFGRHPRQGTHANATGGEEESNDLYSPEMAQGSRIIERMVNQNTFNDVTDDFKYWDDPSDQYKEGKGSLLPLWKFQDDRVKRKTVTALQWHPTYSDLFVAGFGSYDFMRQDAVRGAVALYSLKNPSFPQDFWHTDCGVMSIDFHPNHTSLLAVGLYDGNVQVYDVRTKGHRPLYQSTTRTGKHRDPVWQLLWQEDDASKNLNFDSVSSDGRVLSWTMNKDELNCSPVMELKLHHLRPLNAHNASSPQPPLAPASPSPLGTNSLTTPGGTASSQQPGSVSATHTVGGPTSTLAQRLAPPRGARPGMRGLMTPGGVPPAVASDSAGGPLGGAGGGAGGVHASSRHLNSLEDDLLCGLAGGCALAVHPSSSHLFLVGTEEGVIHKCSKAYSSQYLETYAGHHMSVYSTRWNPYHPNVFLSCGADWTVRLWDHTRPYHMLSFDLNSPVGDAAWAPFSSTTFAACTSDGKVHVFDLNLNKQKALCEQPIVKRAHLTKLEFNRKAPVLLVGDDRGTISSMKLSPNLRQVVAEGDKEQEVTKMDGVLQYALQSRALQLASQSMQHETAH
eukprot:gnl/Trimastix_PCT/3350.p1 GENE.gnl/Trimastix_PCT/3350~~gnl/Trimastix_PCT/3350.p1  ORF type:complete len:801 (-),score=180.30 gnl/Trimastix_PCT/3350:207-2609(-)